MLSRSLVFVPETNFSSTLRIAGALEVCNLFDASVHGFWILRHLCKMVLVVNLVQLLPVSLLTYNCVLLQVNFSQTIDENKVLLYWNASETLLAHPMWS